MPNKQNKPILVTGATGRQGGAVFRSLQNKGFPVRAMTREPEKREARDLIGSGVEVVRGDMDDPVSLTRALDGMYGVYSMQYARHGAETEVREGINLADAAKKSQISHFIYSSVGAADQNTGIPHFESKAKIEQHVRDTGLPFTIVRPVFFMENWLAMRGQIELRTLALPLNPDTKLQMIAVDDIGACVSAAFEHPGKYQGRTIEIAGDELSMTDLARAFSRITGKDVHYMQVPWDQFKQQAGPEMTKMYRWFQDVGYHVDIAALRQEYPNLMSFDRWLNTNWKRA
ncbi:MAG TPA: NmrA/HSCARG family protein [Bryobacteraceae bacterium]|nr:NmrA/HSCARG family protein [Bryobacteraceae bacterium]